MGRRERVDVVLVNRRFFCSRERAQAAILEGRVLVDNKVVHKAGTLIDPKSVISIKGEEIPFVSRGGVKLKRALDEFKIDVKGQIALDVGVSTGGFTDCLLQHGAKRVIAVDVGYGQIAWRLRQDPKVYLLERTNIRYLTPDKIPALADIATVDLSFISVKKITANLIKLLKPKAKLVVLIKPQFEAGREFVGKGGIVKDPKVYERVLVDLWRYFEGEGFEVKDLIFSPLRGAEGNIEFLMYLVLDGERKTEEPHILKRVKSIVEEAQISL